MQDQLVVDRPDDQLAIRTAIGQKDTHIALHRFRPNDQDQLPGRLQLLHATKPRNAGPVNCIRWFGDDCYPESTPDPHASWRWSTAWGRNICRSTPASHSNSSESRQARRPNLFPCLGWICNSNTGSSLISAPLGPVRMSAMSSQIQHRSRVRKRPATLMRRVLPSTATTARRLPRLRAKSNTPNPGSKQIPNAAQASPLPCPWSGMSPKPASAQTNAHPNHIMLKSRKHPPPRQTPRGGTVTVIPAACFVTMTVLPAGCVRCSPIQSSIRFVSKVFSHEET